MLYVQTDARLGWSSQMGTGFECGAYAGSVRRSTGGVRTAHVDVDGYPQPWAIAAAEPGVWLVGWCLEILPAFVR